MTKKPILSDIVLDLMAQLEAWEPVDKESIEVCVVRADGQKIQLWKDRITHEHALKEPKPQEDFESALAETTERHGEALKKLADK